MDILLFSSRISITRPPQRRLKFFGSPIPQHWQANQLVGPRKQSEDAWGVLGRGKGRFDETNPSPCGEFPVDCCTANIRGNPFTCRITQGAFPRPGKSERQIKDRVRLRRISFTAPTKVGAANRKQTGKAIKLDSVNTLGWKPGDRKSVV